MEELLAKINYLIREKLWCSIRTLCDDVSQVYHELCMLYSAAIIGLHPPMSGLIQSALLILILGAGQRPGSSPYLLEGLRNLQ